MFTRDEVELFITDPRIKDDRRVLCAILALTGVRFGEAAALRWSSYLEVECPPGKLLVGVATTA